MQRPMRTALGLRSTKLRPEPCSVASQVWEHPFDFPSLKTPWYAVLGNHDHCARPLSLFGDVTP